MTNSITWKPGPFSWLYLIIVALSASPLHADTHAKSLVFLYGPAVSIARETLFKTSIPESTLLEPPRSSRIFSNETRAHFLLCEGQILELEKQSSFSLERSRKRLILHGGTMTLHAEETADTLCYELDNRGALIRYASPGIVWLTVSDSTCICLSTGQMLAAGASPVLKTGWFRKPALDAFYLFGLLRRGTFPRNPSLLVFPSARRPALRQRSRGSAGVATYDGQRYYLADILYRLNYRQLEFAYNFWFAFAKDGTFYSEAWNEWKDLVDHIHHIQLFKPDRPVYLRIGLIEHLTFGQGLLVRDYLNGMFLPFEQHSGLETRLQAGRFRWKMFVNDIGRPRVMGTTVSWHRGEKTRMALSYVGDMNQYSNISDDDGDSYPDVVDPEPDIFNAPEDSIIQATEPPRLDEASSRQLHGLSLGARYQWIDTDDLRLAVRGEAAVYWDAGSGLSFPDVTVGYKWIDVAIGLDFQSPHFIATLFNRTYERRKAHFVEREEGGYDLVSIGHELDDTGDWLYGWNNAITIHVPPHARLRTRFRDIYRGDERDKSFALTVESFHALTRLNLKGSFFVEQRNVSLLFRKKTDGESWGLQIKLQPHHTIQGKIRYRERYSDDNGNLIIDEAEIERNITALATVRGDYWWKKLRVWWKNRKHQDPEATDSS